jgi:hypothetical protein
MPANPPLSAAGPRDPDRRPRPLPKNVKAAIVLLVRGDPAEPDKVFDFIEAGKRNGVAPDIMRRWLDRVEVRKFLRAERQAWRAAICAGNESALKRVRDTWANGMVTVHAVRTLESIEDADRHHEAARTRSPGFVIIVGGSALPIGQPAPRVIDVVPQGAVDERPADDGDAAD